MPSKSKTPVSELSKSHTPDSEQEISIFSIVLDLILMLTPPIIGLIWIMKLKKEKCLCSENWMREYINYYYIFIIIHSLLMIILTLIYGRIFNEKVPVIFIFLILLSIISYFIIVYYIHMLKYNKCKCSESIKRDILYVWHIIQIIFGCIFLFTLLYIMYYNIILFK